MKTDSATSVVICTEPVLLDSRTLARLLSVSTRHLAALESTGRIGPLPVQSFGRRRLYDYREIKAWALAGFQGRQQWLTNKRTGLHDNRPGL